MDFSKALVMLKDGSRMGRTGWNGRGMRVEVQYPDAGSKMSLPYFFLTYSANSVIPGADAERVPWVPSVTDIMATDWEAVW